MSWQPCPRCGDGNPWRAVWCEGCGTRLGLSQDDIPVTHLGRDHDREEPCGTHTAEASGSEATPSMSAIARAGGRSRGTAAGGTSRSRATSGSRGTDGGRSLGLDAVRAPDLPTPPKAVRLPAACTPESIPSKPMDAR